MKPRQKLALFLVFLMILTTLAACRDSQDDTEETTTGAGTVTTDETTNDLYDVNGFLKDSLPGNLNYNDENFVILCDNGQQKQVHVDEQNGDLVNDAVWSRERTVRDRLGVNIIMQYDNINWSERTAFLEKVGAYVSSGSSDYDLVVGYNLAIPMLSAKGYCLNLADNEYLELDKPWWPSEYVNNLTYNGKIYCICESGGRGVIRNMSAVLFNKRLMEAYVTEDIYDIVLSGGWTFDKLSQLIVGTYIDLNANNQKDAADQFGYSTAFNPLFDAYFYACGNRLTTSDAEGKLTFTFSDVEHITTYLEKICDFLHGTNDVLAYDPVQYGLFKEEKAVFYGSTIAITDQLKGLDILYGIAPMPKGDESQSRYYTHLGNTYDVWCILMTCEDPSRSGAVLECYSSEAYRQVNPAYFETALKYKYASDDQAAQVYDIIRDSIVIDLAYAYSCVFGRMPMLYIRDCLTDNNRNWASIWRAQSRVLERELEIILENISKLDY
ncbi:MAG: hypothetical protein ACOX31_08650 [Eubacteriales bacterium]|jgi:hypothetical protein